MLLDTDGSFLVAMDFLHYSGIGLCSSAAATTSPDYRANCHQFILPIDAGLLSRVLHSELVCSRGWR